MPNFSTRLMGLIICLLLSGCYGVSLDRQDDKHVLKIGRFGWGDLDSYYADKYGEYEIEFVAKKEVTWTALERLDE